MYVDDRIINGTAIETVNPETGEVNWWKLQGDVKFSRESVKGLFVKYGWTYGSPLFFKVKGNLAEVYQNINGCYLAIIGANLAKSFRKEPYATFIKEPSNC